ncbi:MAG: NAD(P)H-dependent oxidoreductase subunit E [Eubacteriales bacterium]|jgi:NADH:ubiquinone oxidoreductase subunit E|nr:NAD(P)H-dependent oxidoreductase subunit E [Eubacteriales bacterium]MDD4105359.1 NAD(P)H-dependent oxidoreductase subunit E [Eubacteriales bacterium]MDD4711263.1 NAD(P)H-dependent oxidoreductase subunit E [Eubacteriales bacterium]NLO14570.1 NAD(P)H-dependent oxidoreductase subunit E [Clostridiales bacterium]
MDENAVLASAALKEAQEEEQKLTDIRSVIQTYKDKPGCLIAVLHLAQEIYGFLPLEVQKVIAEGMGLSLSHVSGVVSFYSYFSTEPKAKNAIKICMGTACYVRGGKRIVERLEEELGISVGESTSDGLFSISITRCLGVCGLAPVLMVNEDVHQTVNPDKIDKILAKYK